MGLRHFKICSITIACLFLFFSYSNGKNSQEEQHIEVSLRKIGHQVLLNSGDSTSRVLPIKKEGDRYRIRFATDFGFNPDVLVTIVNKVMEDTKMTYGYIVEVEECETSDIVYSYKIGDLETDNVNHCSFRTLPISCYNLLFTIIGADEQISNSVTLGVVDGTGSEQNKMNYGLISFLIVLTIGILLFLWKKRNQSKIDPNIIPLGEYRFDKRNTELLFQKQRIELTAKEADLLVLLYDAVNTTVERDVILSRVWGDDGDYVGRTLDVFISKLRKKLEANSKVKIVNIRGVGYKLVTNL